MEKVIKIETKDICVNRELVCDLCNSDLYTSDHQQETIYAIFWEDKSGIYLEKYICEKCFKEVYKNEKAVPFELADKTFQDALRRDFKRDWHGIIVSCSSEEEFKKIMENPLLLEILGEKF